MAILPSFQHLRFLCALAEQCHFGRAAESCAVTQSTLSGGIKELEARLGITLFERGHRHVMLTPLGKEIATRAQRLLVDAEELVGLARNAQEPWSGPLRFGVIPRVGRMSCPRCCRIWALRCRSSSCTCERHRLQCCWIGSLEESSTFVGGNSL
jgi:LysR family hydrogen peroxide-inducible transcriptional activator